MEYITFGNYAILASSFGVATFFSLFNEASKQADELLGEKESKTKTFFNFVFWTIFSSISFPFIVSGVLFSFNEVKEHMVDSLCDERMKK